ncbi:unnamed protein product [Caenorhabditis auriculariae]|uniref:Glycosyl transferase 64 domain-containing protein n=1 Tax=Caenorhabditis auriculariae TaxID=2777116 RepID=A0A8S1HIA1_9PELO|nr:unnamed protein product [Caenorhabditis auriculariae]
MRKRGRAIYTNYLGKETVFRKDFVGWLKHVAKPLFGDSFVAPDPFPDDGPLEFEIQGVPTDQEPHDSARYDYNFTSLNLYSYDLWNNAFNPFTLPEFLINAAEPPSNVQIFNESRHALSRADTARQFHRYLGGNQPTEQFTIVITTFDRDEMLNSTLKSFHKIAYLNKIVVVWCNEKRSPPRNWPQIQVPIEFVSAPDSLNSRFIPFDNIKTEAVLSLDDDIVLSHEMVLFSFRVWRENRDQLVGLVHRSTKYSAGHPVYEPNGACQFSLILPTSAFLHKTYLEAYTYQMDPSVREHVDATMNCEDIAMNFLIAHLTKKPPIKTTLYRDFK